MQSKKCIRGILYYGKDSADTLFLYLTFESLGFMVEENKKSNCKETDRDRKKIEKKIERKIERKIEEKQ